MKITVDMDLCDFHGQCEIAAPSLFRLVGPDQLEYLAEAPDELRAEAETAADLCPAQAILVQDSDA